ncbi:FAD-dependent oxidoreductase [Ideonella paludis]|uniref:FAD-dependent oxidoreductase n=1 Tax=Ideonella paludis TaxID=1233411 RepID=UPI00362742CD
MKIAIVGAGIGGLALATMVQRAGHQVCLWERFEQPKPVGSGLVIQPVGLGVLDHLGLGDQARAMGAPSCACKAICPRGARCWMSPTGPTSRAWPCTALRCSRCCGKPRKRLACRCAPA